MMVDAPRYPSHLKFGENLMGLSVTDRLKEG